MGLGHQASQTSSLISLRSSTPNFSPRLCTQRRNVQVRVNSATVGASLPTGRNVVASERPQQQPSKLGALGANGTGAGGNDSRPASNGVVTAATVASVLSSTEQELNTMVVRPPAKAPSRQPQPVFTPVPEDVITEFEHKLEADLQTVGVTITAILGVIIFWRGVWALLDHFVGDSVVGDICCIIVGLTIVLYIRLSGMKLASFWPPS